MDIIVGWKRGSWGYHGNDGSLFLEAGQGKPYGMKFGTGDVIGCGVDFNRGKAYFSRNRERFGKILTSTFYPNAYFPYSLYCSINARIASRVLVSLIKGN